MGGAMILRRGSVSVLALGLALGAALGLALGAALVLAPPCRACSCVPSTPGQNLRRADAAFVGRVVSDVMVETGTTQTFEVDQVYKGELRSTVDVWAQIGTGGANSCAVLYPNGERVAVLLFRHEGRWTTQACSYVTTTELRRVGGPPRAPIEAAPPSSAQADGGAAAFEPPDASGGLPAWAVAAIGALLALGAIGANTVAVARRDRREAHPSGWDPVDEPNTAGSDTR